MQTCENCQSNHDGSYGSGRFCSPRCARGYSTSLNRADISQRVSKKLKGRKTTVPAHKRYLLTNKDRDRAKQVVAIIRDEKILAADWVNLSRSRRKLRLLLEQANLCAVCGINQIWNNLPLVFHYDHILGKSSGEDRSNLRMICPNCHSQTKTYCRVATPEGKKRQLDYLKLGSAALASKRASVAER